MRRLANRQVAGVLVMGLLLVLAGCNGFGGQTTDTATNTTTNGATDGTNDDTDSDQTQMSSYQFTEDESYTYNVTFLGSSSTTSWDVVSVDGENVTVEVVSATSRATQNTTITGNHSTVVKKATRDRVAALFASARAPMAIAGMGDMSSGNFTIESDNLPGNSSYEWDTATVSPQGQTTVNGVGCMEFTVVPDGSQQVLTTCVNEEYPFALSLSAEQNGQTALAMQLENSTRP